YLDQVLVQARASSFGLHDLRFATRSGVRVLLDQAAGIVIDLLVALSLIALATAAVMLAASARAEVQRRLAAIGIQRAGGASLGPAQNRRPPPSRRLGEARCAAGGGAPRAAGGHRDHARTVHRLRAAAAFVGLGAHHARDRPGRARQALPTDRLAARRLGRDGA